MLCVICKKPSSDCPSWPGEAWSGVCHDCRRHAQIGAAVERMESGERLAQVAGEYTVFDDGMTGAVGWHKDPADALEEIRRMKEEGK